MSVPLRGAALAPHKPTRRSWLILAITPSVICALMVPILALGAVGRLLLLFSHVNFDYGEGWNAYWANAAMYSPAALYPVTKGLVANNYPPLSFYMIGVLGRVTGDAIIAGRLVALASLAASAGLAAQVVWQIGRSRQGAMIAAVLLLSFAIFPFGGFFAVNNPQWLAVAITLGALVVLTRQPSGPRSVDFLVAAILMLMAGLIKHNVLDLPVAVAIWLYRRDRRWCGSWIAWGALLSGVICLAFLAIFGRAIFIEIIGFARTFDGENAMRAVGLLLRFIPFVAAGIMLLRRKSLDPRTELVAWFGAVALVLGSIAHLGAGVAVNSHLSALAGGVVLAGLLLAPEQSTMSTPARTAMLALILVPVVFDMSWIISRSLAQAETATQTAAQWDRLIADVRHTKGPVWCEELAVCYWAGKPMGVDFFAYGQKLRTGADPAGLKSAIIDRVPEMIVLDCRNCESRQHKPRLPDPFFSLIDQRYHPVRSIFDSLDELRRNDWAAGPHLRQSAR